MILQRWKENIRLFVIFISIFVTAPSPSYILSWTDVIIVQSAVMTHYSLHYLIARSLSLRYLCCWISNLGSSLILWRFRKRLILDRVTLNGDQHHPLTDPEMHSFRFNFMMLLVFAVFCVVLFSTRVQAKMVPPNFSRWRLISDGSALFRKAPFVTEGLV